VEPATGAREWLTTLCGGAVCVLGALGGLYLSLCPPTYLPHHTTHAAPLNTPACALQRRAAGDLLYVRIETLDGGNSDVLHVTASPSGWFVSRSTDAAFGACAKAAASGHGRAQQIGGSRLAAQ
jgi:hypothetical protein